MKKPVLSKQDFYRRWNLGEFGNKLRTWDRVSDIANDVEFVTIRSTNPNSPHCQYNVPVKLLTDLSDEFTFNESAPDEFLTIQGEITTSLGGLYLFYSTEPTKMRIALEHGKHSFGLSAKLLLQHFCDPSSFDMLMDLVYDYDDHVIEFSCYSTNIGNIPNRNTIIWEVRNY